MSGNWRNPRAFPFLTDLNHNVTSPCDEDYNCIAWAVHCNTEWWDHCSKYWPAGVPRQRSVLAYLAAIKTQGFEDCDDGALEEGYEKIALFAKKNEAGIRNIPTHAARQLRNGKWASKMGKSVDIEHDDVGDVGGGAYGSVVRYLRRPIAK